MSALKSPKKAAARSTAAPPAEPGSDWIHLQNIQVACILGVHPKERRLARRIRMDISVECDTRPAAAADRLDHALNYEWLEGQAVALARKGRFQLVETLAERLAEACLKHRRSRSVRIVVTKPGALSHTQSVAVEIVRRRQGRPKV